MKKLLLIAAFAGMAGAAWAQKPVKGDVTAEMALNLSNLGLFTPGNGSPFQLYNGNLLRGRYFIKDNMAIRGGLSIATDGSTTNFKENPDGTGGSGSVKRTFSDITIMPGIEKHFSGGEKLSTYVGADLMISMASAKETWSNTNGSGTSYGDFKATVDGGWSNSARSSGSGFGVRVVAGADYYFLEKVYLGAEMGWGVMNGSGKDITTTIEQGGTKTTAVQPGGKSGGFSTMINGGIRLGFRF